MNKKQASSQAHNCCKESGLNYMHIMGLSHSHFWKKAWEWIDKSRLPSSHNSPFFIKFFWDNFAKKWNSKFKNSEIKWIEFNFQL
jgi:hypothetical protein